MTDRLRFQYKFKGDTWSQECLLCFDNRHWVLSNISIRFAHHIEKITLGVLQQEAEFDDSPREFEEELESCNQEGTPSPIFRLNEPTYFPYITNDHQASVGDNIPSLDNAVPRYTAQLQQGRRKFSNSRNLPADTETNLNPLKTFASHIRRRRTTLKLDQAQWLQNQLDASADDPYLNVGAKRLLAQECGIIE